MDRLRGILSLAIAMALLLGLAVPALAWGPFDDKDKIPPGFERLEEVDGYKIHFNPETKEYKFEKTSWFGYKEVPERYRATDSHILAAFEKAGVDKRYTHIKRDYSSQYPASVVYEDFQTKLNCMLVTGLPQVTSDGELIDFKWGRVGSVFINGNNWFEAVVDGTQISVTSDMGDVTWNPQLFLNDIEQKPSKSIILVIDPVNSNYSYNVLEWDYGFCKRWVRVIEGIISERWIVESNPYGEIKIKHNHFGTLNLNLIGAVDANGDILEAVVTDDEEIVPASSFNDAVYPIKIGASPLTVYSTSSDGYLESYDGNWDTTHDETTADSVVAGNDFLVIRTLNSAGTYYINRAFLYFDTSTLGAGVTVTAATLSLYGKSKEESNPDDADLGVVLGEQSTPLVATDFGEHKDNTALGIVSYYDYTAFSVVAYNDKALNATGMGWISLTGTTLFCLRNDGDIDDRAPAGVGDSNSIFLWSNEKGAGFYPKLVITYTAPPVVTSSAATAVEETSATLHGNITSTGEDATVDQRGIVYDTSTHADPGDVAPPATYANSWADVGGPWGIGIFSHGLTSLTKGDKYYFRTYAHNSIGYDYSDTELSFLTKPDEPNTLAGTNTVSGQADLTWNRGDGALNTLIRGEDGAYPANKDVGDLVYNNTLALCSDSGIAGGTTRYYRAWSYAQGSMQWSDTYDQFNILVYTLPSLTTSNPTDKTLTTATFNGDITNLGGYASCDQRGFVYDTATHADPGNTAPGASAYASNNVTTGVYITGTYTWAATGLTEGATYYVRACAHNALGWAYGVEKVWDQLSETLWFQPTAIISPTNVPDRSGNANTGTISWGVNPSSIELLYGGIESAEEFVPGEGAELNPPEIFSVIDPNIPMVADPTASAVDLPVYPLVHRAALVLGWTDNTTYGVLMLIFATAFGFGAMVASGSIWGFVIGFSISAAAAGGTGMLDWWIVMIVILFTMFASYVWRHT